MPIRCGAIVLSTAKAMREPDNRIKQIGSHTFFMPISKVKSLALGTGWHKTKIMNETLEEALATLKSELEAHPHVKENPFGVAGSSRKIYDCIAACIKEKKPKSECRDLMIKIFKENEIDAETTLITPGNHLNVAIDAIYMFIERSR